MKDRQRKRRDGDHRPVQRDEIGFVLHDRAAPPFGHLRDAVDAPREDGHVRQHDGGREQLEAARVQEPVRGIG